MVLKRRLAVKMVLIPCVLVLNACAGQPFDTSQLVKPSARCMVAPGRLQSLKEGDDLVQAYASVTRSYGRETSKLSCLQRYVRTVTK